MRHVRALWGWGLLTALLVGAFVAIPAAQRPPALNLGSLIGILLLAVPAIRVNEQGRLIERVRVLQRGVEATHVALQGSEAASQEVRQRSETTLRQRKQDLDDALAKLGESKGAWTPAVHRTLYGGYVLILSSAIARVLVDLIPSLQAT